MKNFILLALVLQSLACKAQTPILPIFNNPQYGKVPGAYYKDTFNDFDNFTGTWIYTNGTTSLKIVLQERSQVYSPSGNTYRDMIVGAYQYIENGTEKVNTLNQLSTNYEVYSYAIHGNIINTASRVPRCPDCPPDQKRVILSFEDPTRTAVEGLAGEIVLRRVDEGGIQKIELWLRSTSYITYLEGSPPPYTSFNVPWGKYVLTKVE